MKRGILIDVVNEQVVEVEWKNLRDVYKLLNCSLVEHVSIDEVNGVYVDEEGLLKLTLDSKFFRMNGYPQPLSGNGLVVGTNDYGESVDTTLSVEDVKGMVTFLDIVQVQMGV